MIIDDILSIIVGIPFFPIGKALKQAPYPFLFDYMDCGEQREKYICIATWIGYSICGIASSIVFKNARYLWMLGFIFIYIATTALVLIIKNIVVLMLAPLGAKDIRTANPNVYAIFSIVELDINYSHYGLSNVTVNKILKITSTIFNAIVLSGLGVITFTGYYINVSIFKTAFLVTLYIYIALFVLTIIATFISEFCIEVGRTLENTKSHETTEENLSYNLLDYFKRLGDEGAKKAYHKLLKLNHSDNGGDDDFTILLTSAYKEYKNHH